MNLWLLLVSYLAMFESIVKGQSVVNYDQSSDTMQYLAGLLNNVMQLLNQQQQQTRQLVQAQTRLTEQLNGKFDRMNEVIIHLNQTVGRLHEKRDQQSQTLTQQQDSLTNLSQTFEQMNEKMYVEQRQNISQLNRTLVQGQYIDIQLSQIISQQNNAIRQMNEKCARLNHVNLCVNHTLVCDGHVKELGVKIDLQNRLNGQINEKLEQQSQLLVEHFNQTLSHQRESLQQVARSILHQQELAFLCSSIPKPTVHNATQSIKQTSNEAVITYTCYRGYEFNVGQTTRSTTCNGTSWTPVDGNCTKQVCRPVLSHVIRGDRDVCALTSFNNQLFVTRENSPIAVYDTTTFALIRNITVSGAGSNLQGLAPCHTDNCLFVSDRFNHKVHKLNLSSTTGRNITVTTSSWYVGGNPRGLSVNRQHNLLVAFHESKQIAEYTPSGSLVRELSDSNGMYHAVEHVVNGTFVVSRRGPVHGVGLMSVDGRVIHSYGSTTSGSGPGQMNNPSSLAVDREGFVLVADWFNNRILVLNPTLSDARPLPLPTNADGQSLKIPAGLWLDESRGRLYVGEWISPYRVLVYDNVFYFASLFAP